MSNDDFKRNVIIIKGKVVKSKNNGLTLTSYCDTIVLYIWQMSVVQLLRQNGNVGSAMFIFYKIIATEG